MMSVPGLIIFASVQGGRSLVDILIGLAIVPYFVSYGLFTGFAILVCEI